MAFSQDSIYTVKDIYATTDVSRAELIDGKVYYMSPPGLTHQRLLLRLAMMISEYIDKNGGTGEVNVAPFNVFLGENGRTFVEPDISVVCTASKLEEDGCKGSPDWILEIVSAGSKYIDYSTKLFAYRAARVREYWIVDPLKKRITTYYFEKDRTEEYDFSDLVPVGIFSGLFIQLEK